MKSEIERLQEEISRWSQSNWPYDKGEPLIGIVKAAKVAEEAGEVCGAAIKMGRPGQGLRQLQEEIADVFITLVGIAEVYDLNLSEVIWDRWSNDVRHRGPKGGL